MLIDYVLFALNDAVYTNYLDDCMAPRGGLRWLARVALTTPCSTETMQYVKFHANFDLNGH